MTDDMENDTRYTFIKENPAEAFAPFPQKATQREGQRFLSLQPAAFREAYSFWLSLPTPPETDPKARIRALAEELSSSHGIPQEASRKAAALLDARFSDPSFAASFADAPSDAARPSPSAPDPRSRSLILASDERLFREYVAADPEATFELACLLLSFLIQYRREWHPNGWVRYDRRSIMHIAGLSSASPKDKEALIAHLHSQYGLRMRVIGSNNPLPCFMLDWAKDHPESSSNPRVDLGPYSPETTFSRLGWAKKPGDPPSAGGSAKPAKPKEAKRKQ